MTALDWGIIAAYFLFAAAIFLFFFPDALGLFLVQMVEFLVQFGYAILVVQSRRLFGPHPMADEFLIVLEFLTQLGNGGLGFFPARLIGLLKH